jgi:hypothetical protein
VAWLRSVKASQAAERLKAASTWVDTGLVITTEIEAVNPRNALRAIRTAAKALGMSGVGLHPIRHSFERPSASRSWILRCAVVDGRTEVWLAVAAMSSTTSVL